MEKIVFQDKKGLHREIDVSFPWLPSRCNVCQGWGHKGSHFKDVVEEESGFDQVPSVEDATHVIGGMLDLLKELEALPQRNTLQNVPLDSSIAKGTEQEEVLQITLSDPTTEVFPVAEGRSWERVNGNS